METGIYHEHKTTIVFGGGIGLVAGGDKEGNFCIMIGELGKKYKKGEKVSDEDAQNLVKNAEVCIFFPTIEDMVVFKDFAHEACENMARYKSELEKK